MLVFTTVCLLKTSVKSFRQLSLQFLQTQIVHRQSISSYVGDNRVSTDILANTVVRTDSETLTPEELTTVRNKISFYKEFGMNVPLQISNDEIEQFMSFSSRARKLKYLAFLYLKECQKQSQGDKRKEQSARKNVSLDVYSSKPHYIYSEVFSFQKASEDLHAARKLHASFLGEEIIIDCPYDNYMRNQDINELVTQVAQLLSVNSIQFVDPSRFVITNLVDGGPTHKMLHNYYKGDIADKSPEVQTTSKSPLELGYKKEDLVYLSPDGSRVLDTYDPTKTYIIGGLVDKVAANKASFTYAEKILGVKSYRLPLQEALKGCNYKKELNLVSICCILNDASVGICLHDAIKAHVRHYDPARNMNRNIKYSGSLTRIYNEMRSIVG